MLEPASHILPGIHIFLLLDLTDYLGRAGNVLLLNDVLLLHMVSLHVRSGRFCHLNHFERLLILRLAPLADSCSAVPLPEHVAKFGK